MTNKDNLQQELKEKVKAGIKPSHLKKLKRSKSADDIAPSSTPNIPLQKSQSQLELPLVNQPSQEQQITQLQEQVKFHAQTSQNYLQSLQSAQAKITELEGHLEKQAIGDADQENIKVKKTQIEDLAQQVQALTNQKQILQDRFEKITQQTKSLQAETQQWNIIDAQQRTKISQQLLIIKDLEQKISAKSEKEKQVDQLEEQILQLRCDKIKEFGDYYEKKQDLERELEENIDEGISEIKRLEQKLLTVNKKKLELQQQLGQSQSKNAQLEMKLLNSQEPTTFNYWPMITIIALSCLAIWIFNQNTKE